jgi:hypothetical protein
MVRYRDYVLFLLLGAAALVLQRPFWFVCDGIPQTVATIRQLVVSSVLLVLVAGATVFSSDWRSLLRAIGSAIAVLWLIGAISTMSVRMLAPMGVYLALVIALALHHSGSRPPAVSASTSRTQARSRRWPAVEKFFQVTVWSLTGLLLAQVALVYLGVVTRLRPLNLPEYALVAVMANLARAYLSPTVSLRALVVALGLVGIVAGVWRVLG